MIYKLFSDTLGISETWVWTVGISPKVAFCFRAKMGTTFFGGLERRTGRTSQSSRDVEELKKMQVGSLGVSVYEVYNIYIGFTSSTWQLPTPVGHTHTHTPGRQQDYLQSGLPYAEPTREEQGSSFFIELSFLLVSLLVGCKNLTSF